MMRSKHLWGVRQVAGFLGVSIKYLKTMVQRGEIPAEKIGKQILFDTDELDKWVAKRQLGLFDSVKEKTTQQDSHKSPGIG